MESYVKQVYNMLYSPILTPWNLVDNAKLDNYKYVNYSRHNDMIMCEMLCQIDDEEVIFRYFFSMDDNLMKITMINKNETTTLFDRNVEIATIKSTILDRKEAKTA